jgi:tRNA(Ile2) C34 agmatinyltransferase TiaS
VRRITKNAARCKKCGVTVESKHVHDFRYCPCGAIFVDGGRDYLRRGGDLDAMEEMSEYEEDRNR